MDPDPFLRNSFWTISIGSLINSITYLGLNSSTIQRLVALPTYKLARNALILLMMGLCMITLVTGLIGMLIYAKYKDCDPSTANVSLFYFRVRSIIAKKYSYRQIYKYYYYFSISTVAKVCCRIT